MVTVLKIKAYSSKNVGDFKLFAQRKDCGGGTPHSAWPFLVPPNSYQLRKMRLFRLAPESSTSHSTFTVFSLLPIRAELAPCGASFLFVSTVCDLCSCVGELELGSDPEANGNQKDSSRGLE